MMKCRLFCPSCLNRILSRTLAVGTFATVGLLSGLAPDFTTLSDGFVFSSVAHAQAVSNTEVTNYARAVLAMEPVRQRAYNRIKQIIGREPPSTFCYQPASLRALPSQARNIAVEYCNQSRSIVEGIFARQKGGVSRFNEITQKLSNDSSLKARIHNELLRLQK